jgi:uncharacterized protein
MWRYRAVPMAGNLTARRAPDWVIVATTVGLLAVSNVMTNRVLPSWAYVPWSVAMTLVLLAVARHDGCTLAEVGLDPSHVRRGLAYGGAIVGAILAVLLVGLALPLTRGLFEDERVGDVGFWGMAYQVFFRIPFGTVLLEEVAFRGVLLGVLLRRTTAVRAALWSSLLFGIWHVLPSIGIESKNPVLEDLFGGGAAWVAVVGAVVGTAVAGLVFCWLRLRSGSLVAPVMLHIATNSLGFLVSWTYLRLR